MDEEWRPKRALAPLGYDEDCMETMDVMDKYVNNALLLHQDLTHVRDITDNVGAMDFDSRFLPNETSFEIVETDAEPNVRTLPYGEALIAVTEDFVPPPPPTEESNTPGPQKSKPKQTRPRQQSVSRATPAITAASANNTPLQIMEPLAKRPRMEFAQGSPRYGMEGLVMDRFQNNPGNFIPPPFRPQLNGLQNYSIPYAQNQGARSYLVTHTRHQLGFLNVTPRPLRGRGGPRQLVSSGIRMRIEPAPAPPALEHPTSVHVPRKPRQPRMPANTPLSAVMGTPATNSTPAMNNNVSAATPKRGGVAKRRGGRKAT